MTPLLHVQGMVAWATSKNWGISHRAQDSQCRVAWVVGLQEAPYQTHLWRGRYVEMMQGEGGSEGRNHQFAPQGVPMSLSLMDFQNTESRGEMVPKEKEIMERVFETTKPIKI